MPKPLIVFLQCFRLLYLFIYLLAVGANCVVLLCISHSCRMIQFLGCYKCNSINNNTTICLRFLSVVATIKWENGFNIFHVDCWNVMLILMKHDLRKMCRHCLRKYFGSVEIFCLSLIILFCSFISRGNMSLGGIYTFVIIVNMNYFIT